jgi:hypothetical protein
MIGARCCEVLQDQFRTSEQRNVVRSRVPRPGIEAQASRIVKVSWVAKDPEFWLLVLKMVRVARRDNSVVVGCACPATLTGIRLKSLASTPALPDLQPSPYSCYTYQNQHATTSTRHTNDRRGHAFLLHNISPSATSATAVAVGALSPSSLPRQQQVRQHRLRSSSATPLSGTHH